MQSPKNKEISKAKEISYAIIAGYLGRFVEEGFARFLHDLTDTTYSKDDNTSSIAAGFLVVIAIRLLPRRNVITTSIFATGVALAFEAGFDYLLFNKDFDFDRIVNNFLRDSITLVLILYFYNQLLDEVKKCKKKDPEGPVFEVAKNMIRALPVFLYFGYLDFKDNLSGESEESVAFA